MTSIDTATALAHFDASATALSTIGLREALWPDTTDPDIIRTQGRRLATWLWKMDKTGVLERLGEKPYSAQSRAAAEARKLAKATPRHLIDMPGESVEAFIARGGEIERIPYGQISSPLLHDYRDTHNCPTHHHRMPAIARGVA